jgi:hypothetical protein
MNKFKSPAFFAGLFAGAALVVLSVLLLRGSSPAAFAALPAEPNPAPQAGAFIMTPGTMPNGNACLWVIDTRNSDQTPSLALYVGDSGKLKLQAARRIKYDFSLLQYNDGTDDKYSPSELKRQVDELNKPATDKSKK